MTAIFKSPVAVQAVQNSAVATAAVAAVSDPLITATVINLAGLTPGSYSNMAALAASSTAMAAVAASSTAMTAVAASTVAMSALAASSVAIAALKASPLCTVFNPANQNAWRDDTFNGSGVLIRISNFNTGTAYYNIDGGSNVIINSQQLDIIKAYRSKLVVHWVDFSGPSDRGIYRIVLTGN